MMNIYLTFFEICEYFFDICEDFCEDFFDICEDFFDNMFLNIGDD